MCAHLCYTLLLMHIHEQRSPYKQVHNIFPDQFWTHTLNYLHKMVGGIANSVIAHELGR